MIDRTPHRGASVPNIMSKKWILAIITALALILIGALYFTKDQRERLVGDEGTEVLRCSTRHCIIYELLLATDSVKCCLNKLNL